ncbi:hypothetical protein FRC03_001655 [Tulasnella sp. 419]|nr:hypothetical protein FRC03_001655 [Tulasnella sp. 419]
MATKRRVSYYYDPDVGNYSYGLGHPMKPHRIRMAHQLISAYGMLDSMDVVRPTRATPLQMTRFHTDEYVDFLNRVSPETSVEMTGGGTRFLVGEDNPAFDGLFEFCSISAGGSINAAERLNSGKTDIAINWAGGLHHAKKREASGFCYVNDIVLSILELLRYHARVLYIDIDCHHGDGVEEAFYTTDRVMTCSFHKQKDYFPGTGRMEDGGKDEEYQSIFEPVIQHIMDWYRPGAVVLQCGADSLSGDKLGVFNLSMHGHANCVRFLRAFNVPLILLGGGGYTIKNVSCAWTYETACALGIEREIDLNLPYNPYLEYYGPRYRLEVQPSNMTDDNHPYLEQTKIQILEGLRDLPFAPSIGMQNVPSASVSQETGIRVRDNDGDSDLSDLDVRIAQRVRSAFADRSSSNTESSDSDEPLRSRHPHSLLSYFPNRQRQRDANSSDDDDETESEVDDDEDDNDSELRRSRRKRRNVVNGRSGQRRRRSSKSITTPADGFDGLVFGNRTWLEFPAIGSKSSSSTTRNPSKRTFFKKTGPVWSSGGDRALALGLSMGRDVDGADDAMDLNDDNDGGGSGVGSVGWSANARNGNGLQPYSYPYRTPAIGNAASPMSLS